MKCPPLPPAITDVYQVDTDQLGVILLTWQVPSSQLVEGKEERSRNGTREETPVQKFTSEGLSNVVLMFNGCTSKCHDLISSRSMISVMFSQIKDTDCLGSS